MVDLYHGYCNYLFEHGRVTEYKGMQVKLMYGVPFRMEAACVLHSTTFHMLELIKPQLLHLIQKYGSRDVDTIKHREGKEVALLLGPVVGLLRFILPSCPTDGPAPRRQSLSYVTANFLVSSDVSIEQMHGLLLWHYCYVDWLLQGLGFSLKQLVMNFTVVHCTFEEEARVRLEMEEPIENF